MKKWTRWRIVESKGRYYIKRNGLGENTGKTQNYPAKKYNDIQDKYDEMDSLVLRLNHAEDEKRRQRFLIENAFIPQKYVDDFVDYVSGEHGRDRTTREMISPFMRYGLKYLQNKHDPNPSTWPEIEKDWGNYLLNKNFSKSYVRGIIQTTNRFLKYTHERNRNQFPMVKLNPISTHRLNMYEEKRKQKLNVDGKRDDFGYYISDDDKKLIFKNLTNDIYAVVRLMDLYGLRESEALALACNEDALTEEYLDVRMQLISVGRNCENIETDLPKFRKVRETPHWHDVDLEEIAELIESIKIMHSDTLVKKFAKCTDGIGTSKTYRLHDFRRTFITRAFDEGRLSSDIMDAVGHNNLKTTLRYRRPKNKKNNKVIKWKRNGGRSRT